METQILPQCFLTTVRKRGLLCAQLVLLCACLFASKAQAQFRRDANGDLIPRSETALQGPYTSRGIQHPEPQKFVVAYRASLGFGGSTLVQNETNYNLALAYQTNHLVYTASWTFANGKSRYFHTHGLRIDDLDLLAGLCTSSSQFYASVSAGVGYYNYDIEDPRDSIRIDQNTGYRYYVDYLEKSNSSGYSFPLQVQVLWTPFHFLAFGFTEQVMFGTTPTNNTTLFTIQLGSF